MNLLGLRGNWAAAALAWALAAAMPLPVVADSPAAHSTPRNIDIDVVARKPLGGARTVRVAAGTTVVLHVRADEPLSVHVHGYDAHADAAPGHDATLTFRATWVGRFPIAAHLPQASGAKHAAEPTLAYLEVLPE